MGLRGIFDPENGFFRTLSRMVDVVGLSLLWVVLSLPLVTFGPACAALYHTVTHCVVRQGDSTYLTFFRSFRANLRVGILPQTLLLILLLFVTVWTTAGFFPLAVFTPALNALLASMPAERVIRRYLPEKEPEGEEL